MAEMPAAPPPPPPPGGAPIRRPLKKKKRSLAPPMSANSQTKRRQLAPPMAPSSSSRPNVALTNHQNGFHRNGVTAAAAAPSQATSDFAPTNGYSQNQYSHPSYTVSGASFVHPHSHVPNGTHNAKFTPSFSSNHPPIGSHPNVQQSSSTHTTAAVQNFMKFTPAMSSSSSSNRVHSNSSAPPPPPPGMPACKFTPGFLPPNGTNSLRANFRGTKRGRGRGGRRRGRMIAPMRSPPVIQSFSSQMTPTHGHNSQTHLMQHVHSRLSVSGLAPPVAGGVPPPPSGVPRGYNASAYGMKEIYKKGLAPPISLISLPPLPAGVGPTQKPQTTSSSSASGARRGAGAAQLSALLSTGRSYTDIISMSDPDVQRLFLIVSENIRLLENRVHALRDYEQKNGLNEKHESKTEEQKAKEQEEKRRAEERDSDEEEEWRPPLHSVPISKDVRDLNFAKLAKSHRELGGRLFDVIMMDPPWQLATSNPTRGVAIGYEQLTDQDIKDLRVDRLQENGYLFMWVVNSKFELALEMFDRWGYEYVDDVTWVKSTVNRRLAKGHGYYLQHAKETCIIGKKGKDPPGFKGGQSGDVIFAVRRGQSQKPEAIYHIIERMVPNGFYLEIFGRRNNLRNYWVTIGNEL